MVFLNFNIQCKKCCGLVPLRKGCILIAYVMLTWDIVCICGSILYMLMYEVEVKTNTKIEYLRPLFWFLMYSSVVNFLDVWANLSLLLGLERYHSMYLKAYLYASTFLMFLFVLSTVALIGFEYNFLATIVVLLLRSWIFVIWIVYVLTVRSQYLEMKDLF